jgi:hypothetical protein
MADTCRPNCHWDKYDAKKMQDRDAKRRRTTGPSSGGAMEVDGGEVLTGGTGTQWTDTTAPNDGDAAVAGLTGETTSTGRFGVDSDTPALALARVGSSAWGAGRGPVPRPSPQTVAEVRLVLKKGPPAALPTRTRTWTGAATYEDAFSVPKQRARYVLS